MGQQISYLTVIVVHSTMHLMHAPQSLSDNYHNIIWDVYYTQCYYLHNVIIFTIK